MVLCVLGLVAMIAALLASPCTGAPDPAPVKSEFHPMVIAHRGDRSAPENSLQAIHNAGSRRADAVELDVRLTSDGEVVAFHDRRTGRMAANGTDQFVNKLSLRRLQHLPMHSGLRRYQVPTLAQAIEAARQAPNSPRLLLDMKTDVHYAPALMRAVSRELRRARFTNRAMLMSTNADVVRVMRRMEPNWTIGYCYHRAGSEQLPEAADFLVARDALLDQALLARAKERSVPVYAGIGSHAERTGRFMRMGADGVLGDDTRAMRKQADSVPHGVPNDGMFKARPWGERGRLGPAGRASRVQRTSADRFDMMEPTELTGLTEPAEPERPTKGMR